MHSEMLRHFAKRGVQVVVDQVEQSGGNAPKKPEEIISKLPPWGMAILAITIALGTLLVFSIRYTLWGLVSTLAVVEKPQNTYLLKQEKDQENDQVTATEALDSEVLLVKQKPITANIRNTIRHLQSRAGFRARWRGLALFLCYTVVHGVIESTAGGFRLMDGPLRFFSPSRTFLSLIGSLFASAVLTGWSTTWVHVVISEPSAKTWFKRVPGFKTWKHAIVPTVVSELTAQLSMILPAVCFALLQSTTTDDKQDSPQIAVLKLLVCFAIGLVTFIGLAIPAAVSMARVQASMLPEEHESIVPFDRSFGGRVVPAILGGSGAVSMKDAWMTFERPARLRLLGLLAKFVVIDVALHVFLGLTLGVEAALIIGPKTVHHLCKGMM